MTTSQTKQTCQLLSAKTLGDMLSLSKRKVFMLNSCGKIHAPFWIGAAMRWSERTVNRWIEAGTPDRRTIETMQEAER